MEKPTHSFTKWSPEESTDMFTWLDAGVTPEEIAVKLQRTPNAIKSRVLSKGITDGLAAVEKYGITLAEIDAEKARRQTRDDDRAAKMAANRAERKAKQEARRAEQDARKATAPARRVPREPIGQREPRARNQANDAMRYVDQAAGRLIALADSVRREAEALRTLVIRAQLPE